MENELVIYDSVADIETVVMEENFIINRVINNVITQTTQIFNLVAKNINTGALVDGVAKSVPHGFTGYTDFGFIVNDYNTDMLVTTIKVDPANPLTHFLIVVEGIDYPAGLLVTVIPTT